MSISTSIRLNKFISESGFCSRREADRLIESNRVKINGKRPELGTRVEAGDTVTVDGQAIKGSLDNKSDRVYLAYNKPAGIICTTDQEIRGNIIDAIDHHERIFPIGRLDKPSEGLILLTSDGDIVNKILRAENAHEKEYLVTVNKGIAKDFADQMSRGIPILGTVTKPCKVSVIRKTTFKITLTQGLNRQIRRMCEYLGYEVKQLVRLRIMNVQLGKLRPGQWRNLNTHEMDVLNAAIAESKSGAADSEKSSPSRKIKPAEKRKPSRGQRTANDQRASKKSGLDKKKKPTANGRPGSGKHKAKPGKSNRPEKGKRAGNTKNSANSAKPGLRKPSGRKPSASSRKPR